MIFFIFPAGRDAKDPLKWILNESSLPDLKVTKILFDKILIFNTNSCISCYTEIHLIENLLIFSVLKIATNSESQKNGVMKSFLGLIEHAK